MKTTILMMLSLMAVSGFLSAQDLHSNQNEHRRHNVIYEQPSIAERTYNDSTGSYVIKFTYGMFRPYESVIDCRNKTRYSAFIEVFKVENDERSLIGHGFMGTYAPEGCIYDEAEYLISEAKKIEMRASSR